MEPEEVSAWLIGTPRGSGSPLKLPRGQHPMLVEGTRAAAFVALLIRNPQHGWDKPDGGGSPVTRWRRRKWAGFDALVDDLNEVAIMDAYDAEEVLDNHYRGHGERGLFIVCWLPALRVGCDPREPDAVGAGGLALFDLGRGKAAISAPTMGPPGKPWRRRRA